MQKVHCWNRNPTIEPQKVVEFTQRDQNLPVSDLSMLPFGQGRSYGDVCLNDHGLQILTRKLDKFIAFDPVNGLLTCEAGVTLREILQVVVPQGWFLPVTPGTQFVSVGGAIANDVHGKNHHISGTFCHFVHQLELLRSDGQRIVCGPDNHIDWFQATAGGLGLTGLITWAEIQLIPVVSPLMNTRQVKFANLEEFWSINSEAGSSWPYTVSWVDCLAMKESLGRGIFMMGEHAPSLPDFPHWKESTLSFPVELPFSLVNSTSTKLFNHFYYHRPIKPRTFIQHYQPFFHPLDSIQNWNRMYGSKGFYQYQCVIPLKEAKEAVKDLLLKISDKKVGSFLAVLKTFGNKPPAGLLSFAREGLTLALDFPNQGRRTKDLLNELDTIVAHSGGAVNPSKDARMPARLFQAAFPQWQKFSAFVDPSFSSGFWRRVTDKTR